MATWRSKLNRSDCNPVFRKMYATLTELNYPPPAKDDETRAKLRERLIDMVVQEAVQRKLVSQPPP